MREVRIEFVGVPAPKGNLVADPRCARGLRPSFSKKLARWQRAMARTLRTYSGPRWRLSLTPVHVHLEFRFARPAGHVGVRGLRADGRRFPAPTGRTIGDGDKLQRAVWDALVPKVLDDDSLIASWSGAKRWCREGEEPGCTVTVRDADL